MTYQSLLYLQKKVYLWTNLNIDHVQIRNYALYDVLGNTRQARQACRFEHRPAYYYAQENIQRGIH